MRPLFAFSLKRRSTALSRLPARAFSGQEGAHRTDERRTIDFGYEQVDYEQKEERVKDVFDSVAESYDVMNDVMSLGIHRCWKDHLVNSLGPLKRKPVRSEDGKSTIFQPLQMVDVAGGTGDVAFRIFDKARASVPYYAPLSIDLIVADINGSMLEVGKKRAKERGIAEGDIRWLEANCETMPELISDSLDVYTIAFGIRNVTNREKALAEAYRVLDKGGRFVCLEFADVQVPVFKQFYDFYSLNVIPQLGQMIAGDAPSYKYLVESIRKFPKQREFARMIEEAGFKNVTYENLTGGIVAIHSGYKI